ncbi:MAG: hypothetical protein CMG64_00320 [Candidatus Marinimicrobia bacterium]|nr:hypothetical protein [Candidatus Neomarinimicrobiota bacterium]|tara:strand:- start:26160 stop:27884 length:1725 start_codon:yes stop_codon:yes gene_type:complete
MSDIKRMILAGFLITGILLFLPYYLNLIGYIDPAQQQGLEDSPVSALNLKKNIPSPGSVEGAFLKKEAEKELVNHRSQQEKTFIINTPKYSSTVSSLSGGSLTSYIITENKSQYKGGYSFSGEYNDSAGVELILNNRTLCAPCVSVSSPSETSLLSVPFSPVENLPSSLFLSEEDSLSLNFEHSNNLFTVKKTITFYGDSFIINHKAQVFSNSAFSIGLVWDKGLRPTEKNLVDAVSYAHASLAEEKNIENMFFAPSSFSEKKNPVKIDGVDWAAIRTKYFLMAMLPHKKEASFSSGVISAESYDLSENNFVPSFSASLKENSSILNYNLYLGPLDLDYVQELNPYLDRIMNFGWFILQPFSRSILWLLKFLHSFGINYGIILVLIAVFVRVVTGPLTKKSHQSAQKMQAIQPKLKKIQEKYKDNPKKLNQETINLYKESGTNPLGGCLPVLLQMPLLFALFIVFRSTIEFRGASFFGWISNLSQPDTIFFLPWNIPLYGDQVAFLPILLGITMFLSQSISAATMDSKQKPLMYIMTGFFFLIFNSFPSGLNLYYVVYNFLNYLQLKSLKQPQG